MSPTRFWFDGNASARARAWATSLDRLRQRQRPDEVREVVGERVQVQTYRLGGEARSRQPHPLQRVLALLDILLGRVPLVVEGQHPYGRVAAT